MANQEVERLREEGKANFLHSGGDKTKKALGLKQLNEACRKGDPEARYIIGEHVLKGELKPQSGDPEEYALGLLQKAARRGSTQARVLLNSYCDARYGAEVSDQISPERKGPLTDFDGKRIKIDRKGVFVPVDAKLSYRDGVNCLRFRANVSFVYTDATPPFDADAFEDYVLEGFRKWQGEYQVFGGQKLRVELELTAESRIMDSVLVIPTTDGLREQIMDTIDKMGTGERADRARGAFRDHRSFAAIGLRKWSVRSPKFIYFQCKNDRFDDPDCVIDVAKHEFGHVLGLGDLYASSADGLPGVEKGSYQELDSFYVADGRYNLVMDDETAPVSNNDMEMIVLAFSRNRFQRYQPDPSGDAISSALGKGN